MLRAIGFAVVFAVVGLVVFPLVAALVIPEENMRAAGRIAFPVIVIVCGGAGFVVGWRGRKK